MKKVLIVFSLMIFFKLNLNAQIPSYVPSNGLKAWYPFSGNANDLSGNNFNGNVAGAQLSTDRNGNTNAAYLFGNNQQISIPNTASQNYFPLTISLWYLVSNSQPSSQQNIFSKYTTSSWNGFQILYGDYTNVTNNNTIINNGFGTQSWYARNFSNRVIGYFNSPPFLQPNVSNNTWYHYVFVLDSTGGKIFVNGQLISTDTWDGNPGACTNSFLWKIGGQYEGTTWFNGKIDDIGIWNRALTQQEITNLYNSCITQAPTGNNLQTFCNSTTLSNLSVTGTSIKWYASSIGGAQLPTNTALVNGNTYYASQTLNGCESLNRLPVTAIISNSSVSAYKTIICNGDTVSLTANSNQNANQLQLQLTSLLNSGFWSLKKIFNGHNYLEYKNRLTWPQAKILCELHGGYMFCVNSKIENDSVSIPITNSQLYGDFLLGLYQDKNDPNYSEPSGGWKWLDGQPFLYTNWGQGQPSGGSEDFGIMDWNNMGELWNDTYDNINGTVIMEYPIISTSKYLWSTGATTANINVTPSTTTQYWVDITTNGLTCRKNITITVKVVPAPILSNINNVCKGATIQTLPISINGNSIKWYTNVLGGQPLFYYELLEDGVTYYASQTINGCESVKRTPVTIFINKSVVSPSINYLNKNDTAIFNATKLSTASLIWQTNVAGLGWINLFSNNNYQLTASNKVLAVNNIGLSNHLQNFRVISQIGSCKDTSNIGTIFLTDTCITKVTVNDTVYHHISVTDTLIIKVNLSSSISVNTINEIKIYPNPAKDYIWIDYGNYSNMNNYSMKISNMLGQVVYNQNVTQQKVQIDLNSWTGKGTYLVELFDNGQLIEVKKIILE